MSEPAVPPPSVTTWLLRLREGDPVALEQLLPLVYDELRVLARSQLRAERHGHTLNATALVHEAYLRLCERDRLTPADRRHFFAIAARSMRRVLIDHARARNRQKRGGGAAIQSLGDDAAAADAGAWLTSRAADELLALDEALQRLAGASERAARVVEHRFFAGLSLEETADVLGVSLKTVQRDWLLARAWLRKEIAPP
jgi:RNA polymerase sigma-70 factor, ECF subfamily